jgi:hypothetical protein
LGSGTEEEKQSAAIVAGILASFNDDKRLEMVKNNVHLALFRLLRNGTTQQQCYASDALRVLSDGNDDARRHVGAWIIEFATLLRDGTDEQKESLVAVIAIVARGDDTTRKFVVDWGVIAPLAALVENGTSAQKGHAALALANLALCDYTGEATDGGIQALMGLLQTGTDAHKKIAAIALVNIASNSIQLFDNISDMGGVVPLVALLRAGTVRVRGFAARELQKLAFTDAIAADFVHDGGLAPIMELLQTGTDQEKEDAVHVVSKLNMDEDIGAFIASSGGIASIVVLTRSGADDQRDSAVIVLRKLAGINEALRREILDEGGFTMLETLGLDGHESKQEDPTDQEMVAADEDNDTPIEAQAHMECYEHASEPDDTVQTGPQRGKQGGTAQIGSRGGKHDHHVEKCGTSASTDAPIKKRRSRSNAGGAGFRVHFGRSPSTGPVITKRSGFEYS